MQYTAILIQQGSATEAKTKFSATKPDNAERSSSLLGTRESQQPHAENLGE